MPPRTKSIKKPTKPKPITRKGKGLGGQFQALFPNLYNMF